MRIHMSFRRVTSLYTVFAIVMCYILLALSGCGNPAKGSIVPSTQKTPRSSPTSLPLHSRIGGPEVTTESILRAQLARVQQIMAGVSLLQKIVQLLPYAHTHEYQDTRRIHNINAGIYLRTSL